MSTTAEQLRRLQEATDTARARLDLEKLLAEPLERVRELLGVDTAAVLLIDSRDQQLVATATRGLEEEVRQGARIPLGAGFAGRIAADKRPLIVDRVDRSKVVNPILVDKKISSLLGVPLLTEGIVLGVLHVGTLAPRRFSNEDVQLLELAADQVALVTQAGLSEAERAAATMLQRSLLSAAVPAMPGLELANRYVASEQGGVGGDWYDVFTLPSGRLGIVIGDVVGRGLAAAGVMSRLRGALRIYALDEDDPAAVLGQLDRSMQHFEPGVMATVLYATLEPSLDRLRVTSAGHLPPVLALPGQPAVLVDIPTDIPLGVRIARPRGTTTVELPPGAVLALYTDGLVERRGDSLHAGLTRLCRSVVSGPAEAVCAAVMNSLIGADSPGDDVAMLVLHRPDNGQRPLQLEAPALSQSLWEIRLAARRWLSAVGAVPYDVQRLLVTIGEACANVVRHAYGPSGGIMTVHLELQFHEVVATIQDTGRWRPPSGETRGIGIPLMRLCSDQVRIDHGPTGTKVLIRHQLGKEATR